MHSFTRSLVRWFARCAHTAVVLLALLCLLPWGGPLAGLAPSLARAATLTVTSTANFGTGSLRDIIAAASAGDTITFGLSANATITLMSAIEVDKALTIDGAGTPGLTISGNKVDRVFVVSAPVVLANMTLADGLTTGTGPDASTLTSPGNTATHALNGPSTSGNGGAVYVSNISALTLTNVVVRDSSGFQRWRRVRWRPADGDRRALREQ